jgi:hypothetical protein
MDCTAKPGFHKIKQANKLPALKKHALNIFELYSVKPVDKVHLYLPQQHFDKQIAIFPNLHLSMQQGLHLLNEKQLIVDKYVMLFVAVKDYPLFQNEQ